MLSVVVTDIAAKRHHLPIVEMLIKYGVPATTRDFYGQTALHSLLESACVNASCDHMAFAEFLISNGIDVNTPNDSGAIPLHLVGMALFPLRLHSFAFYIISTTSYLIA